MAVLLELGLLLILGCLALSFRCSLANLLRFLTSFEGEGILFLIILKICTYFCVCLGCLNCFFLCLILIHRSFGHLFFLFFWTLKLFYYLNHLLLEINFNLVK